jgi:hypothetical protein
MKLFNAPQSPFELEHNQRVLQDRACSGRLLAFRKDNGVVYATPDKAFEALAGGVGEQMTADELAEHHAQIMNNALKR